MLLGHCILPRAFEDNGLIWGANKEYYGECENGQFILQSLEMMSFAQDRILIYRNWSIGARDVATDVSAKKA